MTTLVSVSSASEKLRICESLSSWSMKLFRQRKFEAIKAARTLRRPAWWGQCCGPWEKSLRAKRARFDSRATLPKLGFVFVDKLMAPYQVASSKVWETSFRWRRAYFFTKPIVFEMATAILGYEARMKLGWVTLWNNVIQSRITDLSWDISEQVISHMKVNPLKITFSRRGYQCFELQSTYCTGEVCP